MSSDFARAARSVLSVATAAMLAVTAGCGDGRPDRVPVSGQVLIDGKPLGVGFIRLIPENARAAWARIGADGRFTLSTFEEGDGAVPGAHPVVVRAGEALSPTQVKWHAPKKYANVQTSRLTVTITGPTDSLVIELSWDGGKPFVETIDAEPGEL